MTVPNVPFWGSAIVAEFGNPWISGDAAPAGLGFPLMMSQFAGRSAYTHTLTIANGSDSHVSVCGYNSNKPNNPKFGAVSPTTTPSGALFGQFSFMNVNNQNYYCDVTTFNGGRPADGATITVEGLGTISFAGWVHGDTYNSWGARTQVSAAFFNWMWARIGGQVHLKVVSI